MDNDMVMKTVAAGLTFGMLTLLVGCKSTLDDRWRSDMATELAPAKFKPVYRVLSEKGIVKGQATKSYWFWFIDEESPVEFANPITNGSRINFVHGVEDAAMYDACVRSGATILLAPRFTRITEKSFLGFSGKTTVYVEGIPARLEGAKEIDAKDAK